MTKTDSFRAQRLIWRFKKSGGSGEVLKPLCEHRDEVREQLLAAVQLHPGEEPAIGLFRKGDDWVLVTSQRVLWNRHGGVGAVDLSALADATVDISALEREGGKERVQTLTLLTRGGARVQLYLEAGAPFSGAWNALKMAASWDG